MEKQKVALVLSGGGARGIAHIGVIEELEKNGFEITSIAGTSMGSMVGAIYALGKLNEFKEWLYNLSKRKIYHLVDLTFRSQGFIKGERLINELKEFIPDQNIEDLSLPFTATAGDVCNKEEVVFREGSIFKAVRASVAIPIALTPVIMGDKILVDGGTVNNIPISNVKRNKGDILVVVNVNAKTPKLELKISADFEEAKASHLNTVYRQIVKLNPVNRREKMGLYQLMDKTISLMIYNNSVQVLKHYKPDILINISRDSCGTYDFYMAEELVEIGRYQAKKELEKQKNAD